MTILEFLKAVYVKLKEKGGIWSLVKMIFSIEKWIILRRDIEKPVPDAQMEGCYQIRIAKINDFHLFEKMSKKVYIDLKSILNRLASGQTCYMALDENEIIYFVWISPVDIPKTVTSHFIKLKPGEVCMYHALCLPEYRGKKIHSSVMSVRLKDLQKQSIDKAYVDCLANNIYQLKTLSHYGFIPIKNAFVLTIAGKKIFYLSKGSDTLTKATDN